MCGVQDRQQRTLFMMDSRCACLQCMAHLVTDTKQVIPDHRGWVSIMLNP